jgi:hypothetical protein
MAQISKRILPLESEHPSIKKYIKDGIKMGIDFTHMLPSRPIQEVTIILKDTNAGFANMLKVCIQQEIPIWYLDPAVTPNDKKYVCTDDQLYNDIIELNINLLRINQSFFNKHNHSDKKFHLEFTSESKDKWLLVRSNAITHDKKNLEIDWLCDQNTPLFKVRPGTVISIPLSIDRGYSYVPGNGGSCSTVNNIKYAPIDQVENFNHMIGMSDPTYPTIKMKNISKSTAFTQNDRNWHISYQTYRNFDDGYEILQLALDELDRRFTNLAKCLDNIVVTHDIFKIATFEHLQIETHMIDMKYIINGEDVPFVTALSRQIYEDHPDEAKVSAENTHPSERKAFIKVGPIASAHNYMKEAVKKIIIKLGDIKQSLK